MSFSGKNMEAAKAALKSAWRTSEGFLRNRTKIEMLVFEATNDVAWGPTGQQMADIAEASYDAENFKQVWGVLLQRFASEPKHWRRIYKALLLTEHLMKNSSQHAVQVVLDGAGAIEGLKHFKFLDEKNKDQGINVSNRAKELLLLLADPDRIRVERAKAKALKGKFSGVSKEQMAAGGRPDGSSPSSWTAGGAQARVGMSSSMCGSAADANICGAQLDRVTLGGGVAGLPCPTGRIAPLAPGHSDLKSGEERLGGGPTALLSTRGLAGQPADPMTATAQRIQSLRQAGALCELPSPAGSASSAPASSATSPPPAAALPSSTSHDDLSVARSRGSQTKPSLAELTARKAGPKRLQDVHINPAIRAALGGVKAPPTRLPHAQAPTDPPPAGLAPLPAALAAVPASLDSFTHQPARSPPPGGSPAAHAAPHRGAAGFADFVKPGGSPCSPINLTAVACPGGKAAAWAPLEHVSADAALPLHSSAAAWGSRLTGAEPKGSLAVGASLAAGSPKGHQPAAASSAALAGEDPFSEFDPFKGA